MSTEQPSDGNRTCYQIAALVADKMKSQIAVMVSIDSRGNVALWSHPDLTSRQVANTLNGLADKKHADAERENNA